MPQLETIKSFTTLKKNLKKNFEGLKTVRLAVLGDSATQLMVQALRSFGYEEGFNFEIFEADYNQVEQQLFDKSSQLFAFKPEFVIIYQSTQKLLLKYNRSDKTGRGIFANKQLETVCNYYESLQAEPSTRLIYLNFAEINDGVFGNYSNKTDLSFLYQLRNINLGLMNLSQKYRNLFICDMQLLSTEYGINSLYDPKLYYSADMSLGIEILPHVAKNISLIVAAGSGKFKKCLILDLDNTIWGGVIGDDGPENIELGDLGLGKVFTDIQLWAKQLKERGIILAVCSKNDEAIAREPFEKHPDMVLKPEDIAVFVANWNNKADNIRYIQSVLNIGFDSMVFIDDNPFERELVKANLPEVTVPELPEDPAQYMDYLAQLNLFETVSFSEEDEIRTQQYREESGRITAQKNFTNEDDFLKSLDMLSEVRPFNAFNCPRVAQLSQRSNQFNLRTVRYTEEDITRLVNSNRHINLAFTLKDRFGDNGLIAVIVGEKQNSTLFIETWLMSCRVLKRGMENFALNCLVDAARQFGVNSITGEYLPTAKNGMVKNHYERLGFESKGNIWVLELANFQERKNFISKS